LRHPGGITIAELAELRGVSKDAARRLVRTGKVVAHQAPGTHGLTWCVHPDESPTLRQGSTIVVDPGAPPLHNPGTTVAPGSDLTVLVALVDRLERDNRDLAASAAMWQERARVLADQLALPAPESPQAAPLAAESVPLAPTSAGSALAAWMRWRWLLVTLAVAVLAAGWLVFAPR